MPRNSIGSHKEQIKTVPFDIFTILTDIFLQDSSKFESYTLPHLNTMGESQKLLSFVVNKRVTQVRGGVTNYQISAFHTSYVGLLASGLCLTTRPCTSVSSTTSSSCSSSSPWCLWCSRPSKGWPAHLAQMRTSDCLLSRLMVLSSLLITRSRWSRCLHFF